MKKILIPYLITSALIISSNSFSMLTRIHTRVSTLRMHRKTYYNPSLFNLLSPEEQQEFMVHQQKLRDHLTWIHLRNLQLQNNLDRQATVIDSLMLFVTKNPHDIIASDLAKYGKYSKERDTLENELRESIEKE